jgi:ribosome biogenesis GTPase A
MEPYWDVVERIINESDIVLEILDARVIELSRNEEVERLVKEIGRPLIFVINKSDLISKKLLKKQIGELRVDGEVVFISNKDKRSVRILLYAIKKVFRMHGKRKKIFTKEKPKFREALGDIVVGVLGYPNVGKSSIINSLAHKGKAKVSKKAGTTHGVQWVRATDEIKLIDTPGVIPLKREDEIRYSLISAKNPEKISEPENVVIALIKLFLRHNKNAFENFYKISISNRDFDSIIDEIATKKGHLVKGGKPDKNRTCYAVIRDWQQGKLRM